MTGTDITAVAMRTRFTKTAFVNERDVAAGLPQIPCGEATDDSATNDDSMRRFGCHGYFNWQTESLPQF